MLDLYSGFAIFCCLWGATSGQHVFQKGDAYATTGHQKDWLPRETRDYWMRKAIETLASPCAFAAFGSVIVNHTRDNDLGDLICSGANAITTGNPSLHGEIAAINNCSAVLTEPSGRWGLTGAEVSNAFSKFTLYTTAEPCPMCAAAIRWAGFRECVFGTSIPTLIDQGWSQIQLRAHEVFERSQALGGSTTLFESDLNETHALFAWQFDPDHACPDGCERPHNSADTCRESNGMSNTRSEL